MNPLSLAQDAPWKKRFRAPVVISTQRAVLRPERGLAVSNQTGIFQLHAWDIPTGTLRQLTDKSAGVVYGGISPDGKYVYYHDDEQGNEIGHYKRVPFEGGEPEDITPDMPPYASFSISQSLNGQYLGFMAAGADGFKMYVMEQAKDGTLGQPELLYTSGSLSFGPIFSYDGDYAIIATTERSKTTDRALLAFKMGVDADPLVLEEQDYSITPAGFAPISGDARLLAYTDVSGFDRPLIWDLADGSRTDIPLADLEGNITPAGWTPDGKKILLTQLNQAQYQLYIYDLENATLNKLNHPGGTIHSAYFMADGAEIYVNWQDAVNPSRVIALDATTGEMLRTVLAASEVPAGRPWRSVTFESSGGVQIQAWLAVPEGDGPFPTILHTHGGPTSVQTDAFSASAQTWLDHGFAWMSVNYRGSVTFGREFEHAIHGMLGIREVDDMAAAYQWLVDHGIAKPDAVLLTGGSYGGYLTLQGLGRRPDLWAGGMAMVAIADWKLMYEDQAETLRGYQRSLFGGTPDELPEQHETASPITYAADINAPVLVIQGSNDTRCPVRQMQAYEAKLNDLGKEIKIHWFDAGHGSRAIEQNIEHQELMLHWAYRVLG